MINCIDFNSVKKIAVSRLVRKCKKTSHSHFHVETFTSVSKSELAVYDRFKKHAEDYLQKCRFALHYLRKITMKQTWGEYDKFTSLLHNI